MEKSIVIGNGKDTSCTTEVHNYTKNRTFCCSTINKKFCDATKSFNFQLQEKYFGQVVRLFWVTSKTI